MERSKEKGPEGISGWLLVYVIFLFVGILFSINSVFENSFGILTILSWILYVIALISLFIKSKYAPLWNKILLGFGLLTFIILFFSIFEDIDLFILLLSIMRVGFFVGWLFYWIKSKRVRNTFINRRK